MPPRVLVTRALQQSSALADELQRRGLEPVILPILEIVPPDSFKALDDALDRIDSYDWLLFTSANAVEVFRSRLKAGLPQGLKVAVIGSATRRAAEVAGLNVALQPERAVAESLADALCPQAEGKRMLLVRASEAREILPQCLRASGAAVDIAEAYRTVIPARSALSAREIFTGTNLPNAITFTSSSSATHLADVLKQANIVLPPDIVLASIGPITSATMQGLGLAPTIEAREATVVSLAEAVAEALSI